MDATPRTAIRIPATDLRVGDRLSHRARVARLHAHNGRVACQVLTHGSNAPGVASFAEDEIVTVYRRA